jgi:hypothetical protein
MTFIVEYRQFFSFIAYRIHINRHKTFNSLSQTGHPGNLSSALLFNRIVFSGENCMQHAQRGHHSSIDAIRIDFMDVYYEIHQRETEVKKRSKARKRYEARKAIEEHLEKKRLQALLKNGWEEV